ncbi:MAG TPA: hypothetical protein VL098_08295 [Flavipsychrobacter sp.]|nr:hypothetical protein [Flavipsychrobacter sp.]
MKVYKPSIAVTIKYSIVYILFFIVVSLFSYKQGFSWIVIALMFLAVVSVAILFRNRITKIEIDVKSKCVLLHKRKFIHTDIEKFSLLLVVLEFAEIKGARGMNVEVFRFNDGKKHFDMHFGLNGWSREMLIDIQRDIIHEQNLNTVESIQ